MGFFDFVKDAAGAVSDVVGAAGAVTESPWLGIGSSMLSGWLGSKGVKDTNEANAAMSQKQMDFQERMSSTAYQRGVKDMMAAGLNPMLAYSQGGASSPTGSIIPMQNATGAGISAASQAASLVASLQNTKADTALKDSQAENIKADTVSKMLNPEYIKANTAKTGAETQLIQRQTEKAGYEIGKIVSENDLTVAQRQLVLQEIQNAAKTGGKISAETGNIVADTALKKIRTRLDELDIPMAVFRSHNVERLNSAQSGLESFGSDLGLGLGNLMDDYKSSPLFRH